MKKTLHMTTIMTTLIIGVAYHSVSSAQDKKSQVEQAVPHAAQSQEFEAPIILSPATKRPASWQGQDVALEGYDVVSYFQAKAPLDGTSQYSAKWDNTTWHFSSEENRDLFAKNPERYVPEFGGYCPVSLSRNHAKVGLTNQYSVIDDKLYLNFNEQARKDFRDTPGEYIVRAELSF